MERKEGEGEGRGVNEGRLRKRGGGLDGREMGI